MRRHKLTAAFTFVALVFLAVETGGCQTPTTSPDPNADAQAVKQLTKDFVAAFNAGKADEVAAMFIERAELTDEAGNNYQGREEIAGLLERFFKKFSGAASTMTPETVKLITPSVAVEKGTRVVTTKDGQASFASSYTLVKIKIQDHWKIASAVEDKNDSALSPNDRLKCLAWLVGEWTDEGAEAVIRISCRWSDDRNYLLTNFEVKAKGRPALKSEQRIGWDPLTKKIKSWTFDSDGGRGEGAWTQAGDRWIIKSDAVLPDGQVGSATLFLEPRNKDSYVMKGFDRVRGDDSEDDFEVTIVRKSPEPTK